MKLTNSINLNKRAKDVIAHGALTNSKRPQSFVEGVYPTHIKRGFGCEVWDVDDNRYIDYICGLGTNLFGYANNDITEAISAQLRLGSVYSLGSEIEVQAAERFKELFPYLERLRFLKTGSEACSAAIRIARSYWGVGSESEKMLQMRDIETIERISSGQMEKRWFAALLQDLCKELSKNPPRDGNKEIGPTEIRQNREGQESRDETLPKTLGTSEEIRQGQGLLFSSEGFEKETLRDLWRNVFPSASQRLFETTRREMVVPNSSRNGTSCRSLILSDGYHGQSDVFVSLSPPHRGTPSDPSIIPLFGNEPLIKVSAAVIVEPIITDASSERVAWLHWLKNECARHGTLLIFDETITAFRYEKLSVANAYGIIPDLSIMGKGIGGGLPLAVVGGRADIMESDYFVSSTFAGDTVALAAFLRASKLIQNEFRVEKLLSDGQRFLSLFNELNPELVKIEGYPSRGIFKGRDELTLALFMQEACKAGILFGPSWFFNFYHAPYTDTVIPLCKTILGKISNNEVRLEGAMPVKPFAQKVRDHE